MWESDFRRAVFEPKEGKKSSRRRKGVRRAAPTRPRWKNIARKALDEPPLAV